MNSRDSVAKKFSAKLESAQRSISEGGPGSGPRPGGGVKRDNSKPFIAKDTGEPLKVLGGYEINQSGGIMNRGTIDVHKPGDHGSDPLGNGKHRMVPSGDIVDDAERARRLGR